MPVPVIMPKFGMTQEDGTILRWLKQNGDHVEKDEPILEVLTDKVDMEVEAPASGTLFDVRFGPDEVVPVTTLIAQIALPGEMPGENAGSDAQENGSQAATNAPSTRREQRASPVAQRMASEAGIDLAGVAGTGPAGRITKQDVAQILAVADGEPAQSRLRATPAARRLGRERGIDLATVKGSGPVGRIQAADVETAGMSARRVQPSLPMADENLSLADDEGGELLRGRRRVIATRLSQSWQSTPHIFLTTSVDMTSVEAMSVPLRGEVEQRGGRLTPTVWVARATASALVRHAHLNAWLLGDGVQGWRLYHHDSVHLGIAVALEDGLIVPVVRDAQNLGLARLASEIGNLAERARTGQLVPEAVTGGSFTISNLGMYPVEHFTAVVNPPEVGILAMGRANIKPVWNGADFEPRSMMQLTLSADHRAVDGAVAAAFLAEIKQLLEEPARLLL